MVRKIKRLFGFVCLALAICVSMATQAHAYSVYDGTISTSYITYFRDMLSKFPVSSDYVFFRSGQYAYTMVVGDLELLAGTISSEQEVTVLEITTNSNYNSTWAFTNTTDSSFSLDALGTIVYSNLGYYPALEERSVYVEYSALFVLCVMCLCLFVRGIFEWRRGLRY